MPAMEEQDRIKVRSSQVKEREDAGQILLTFGDFWQQVPAGSDLPQVDATSAHGWLKWVQPSFALGTCPDWPLR